VDSVSPHPEKLKLKVKRLKMALTLDERVEIVLLSGSLGMDPEASGG
jgi:hypothetical protein